MGKNYRRNSAKWINFEFSNESQGKQLFRRRAQPQNTLWTPQVKHWD